MANLFWKTNIETKNLLATRFKTEESFEQEVFDTKEILEDVFLIKRQVRGGNKSGIPDIVGIDNDGNVCIIEMKNVSVDAAIIPQVLQYAFWAETNPDSIKSLWLECDTKPDELAISWDSFQVRIIIIAPSILRSTLDIVDKINYPVDLIEVKRWIDGDNSFFLVNKLEMERKSYRNKPVAGLQVYDLTFYKEQYNKNSAIEFMKYADELDSLVKSNGWDLERKFNKHYCSFKAGFFNAFGIRFIGSKTFAFFFNISEEDTKQCPVEMTRYDNHWNRAVYFIEPGKTKTKDYLQLFEIAYRKHGGAQESN